METFPPLQALCEGNSPVNSPHKGQWRGALMFSLIWTWTNDGVNNRDAGDFRRHRAHYDVTVMDRAYDKSLTQWKLSGETGEVIPPKFISPWTKWPPFRRRYFQMHFPDWKVLYFGWNFTEVFSWRYNWQQPSTGSDNGLAPYMRESIIWTNADPIHWRIYAALQGDGLKRSHFII